MIRNVGREMAIKEYSTAFGHSIEVTEDEVSICGLKTPNISMAAITVFGKLKRLL